MATSVCRQNTRPQATKNGWREFTPGAQEPGGAVGLETTVPFHLVIAFESYSKIFKDETTKARLKLPCSWEPFGEPM